MDMNRLRYFCTIARTGSIRRAAELLKLSPAALSKSTKLLEAELGLKLVSQRGRNIELTDQGRKLALRGTELLKSIELVRAEVERDSVVERTLKLATFEVFSTYFLKALEHLAWDGKPLLL